MDIDVDVDGDVVVNLDIDVDIDVDAVDIVADVVVVVVVEVEEVTVEVIVIVDGTVDILELFSLRLNGLGFHFILIFAKIDDSATVVGCCDVVSIVVVTVVAKWPYLFLKRDKRPVLSPVPADDFKNTFGGFLSS